MPRGHRMTMAEPKDLRVKTSQQKRNNIQHDADMWWVVREIAKGRTYQSVADELNQMREGEYHLSRMQLWKDVNACMVQWKRENMSNIDAFIGKELARLEGIEEKVMNDYEKSKGLRAIDYAALMKRGMTIEEIDEMFGDRMAGDYHYMETLLHIQQQKMKLLGLENGNDVGVNAVVQYNFNGVSDDLLMAMADQLQDKKKDEMVDEQ